jgi:hypothetical protein
MTDATITKEQLSSQVVTLEERKAILNALLEIKAPTPAPANADRETMIHHLSEQIEYLKARRELLRKLVAIEQAQRTKAA